jgi:hypothetical protein
MAVKYAKYGITKDSSWAEVGALIMWLKAFTGDVEAYKAISDRIEGKPRQRIEIERDGVIPQVIVSFEPLIERLRLQQQQRESEAETPIDVSAESTEPRENAEQSR